MSLLPLYCKILDDSVRPLLPASFMSQALTDAMLFNYSKIPLHYRHVVPIIFWCRSIFSQNNFMSLTVCSQTWQQPCPAYFWKGPTSRSIIAFTFWQIPKTLGNSCQTITKSSRRLINGKKVFDVPSHRVYHESTQSKFLSFFVCVPLMIFEH